MGRTKREFVPRVKHEVIGTYHPRTDAIAKVTGTARYTDDLTSKSRYANMTYLKMLKCPYPHAKIRSVDTSDAEAVPGVLGILRYDDPEIRKLQRTSYSWSDAVATTDRARAWTSGCMDLDVLGDHARWAGEEMGVAIAAETEEAAEEAIRLLKVDWEVLPFVLTIEDSLKPDAPILHPEMNPNANTFEPISPPLYNIEGTPNIVDRGDVQKAFEEADVIAEYSCSYGNPQQCAMDYWNIMIDWGRDQLVCHSNTFGVDQTRMYLHEMLDLPITSVRVISPFEGGQHGRADTSEQPAYLIAAIMSKRIGRPVKYKQTRQEHFHDTRTGIEAHAKMAANKDGIITGYYVDDYGIMGGYVELSVGPIRGVPFEWCHNMMGDVPNILYTGNLVYTNVIPSSCMRSVGNIQANWIFGLGWDMIAEKLDMDPAELVIKNVTCDDYPAPNPGVEKVVRDTAKEFGWERRHAPGKGPVYDGTKVRGMGFSVNSNWHTEYEECRRGPTEVFIKLNTDGTVLLKAPTVEVGTGSNTCAVAAVSEGLGVTADKIRWIYEQDTEKDLRDQVQSDSAVSYLLAESCYQCAVGLKEKFLKLVAKKKNWDADDLDMEDGRVFKKSDPSVGITVPEYYSSVELFEEGHLIPLTNYYARVLDPTYRGIAYMACFVEVEVDTATGEIKVVRMVVSSDGGTIIYPPGAEGQLAGGQCQGLAESLYETMIYDEATGQPLNFNFVDYHFPTIEDWPEVDPMPIEFFKGTGEFGCSGIGESAPCCTPRAIANAVYNAIGVRINKVPITPIDVLEALGKDGE